MGKETPVTMISGHTFKQGSFKETKLLTPSKAIGKECRWCKGGGRWKCESKVCALNRPGGSSLRKIAAHCRECNGDDKPINCTGRHLDGTICLLHPFRLGKNPYRPRTLSPENREKLVRVGAKYHFPTGQKGASNLPGSTIRGEGRSMPHLRNGEPI